MKLIKGVILCVVLFINIGQFNADAKVEISGELKEWHKVTLTVDGPLTDEMDFNDHPSEKLLLAVRFTHESGSPDYLIPGYFAADGDAGESSATKGTKWRAHLSPDKAGTWNYMVKFKGSEQDGATGTFKVETTDKKGIDLRGKGRLQYVGKRYLRYAGSREWFLKAGADSPETFLAYKDFDGTVSNNPEKGPLKTWKPHLKDWQTGDPTWKDGKGKGMIGAINYLAGKGCNAFSFIPYNAGGDGDNVWPHVSRANKLSFDCSKLDQWGIVFDHATTKGMYLHFKLQETENDDLKGPGYKQALDRGELGPERKAYLREMIARYGHHLALNWNLGEENTQSKKQIMAQAKYIREIDPYGHLVVLHTYPDQHKIVYERFLGDKNVLTGISMQNSNVAKSHEDTLRWVKRAEDSGHPWVVAFDEAGSAEAGSSPDPDWPGMAEVLNKNKESKKPTDIPSIRDVRSKVLWGTLMAGGGGVEYYFGYQLPENDLLAEDWRSRDKTWDYSGIALKFFKEHKIPFWEMKNTNELLGNLNNINDAYSFSKKGELYMVYLHVAGGGNAQPKLDLTEVKKNFDVRWFNPRAGGALQEGSLKQVNGGGVVDLGSPPTDSGKDWIVLLTSNQ